ncbi:MAG TPA: glucoamylase family protein [Stellaceae bacterium]|nr:glucoamylase family protein [Stellaceae bacterium]
MPRRSLALRLRDNEAVLLEAYRAIGSATGDRRPVTPAAEWLLDNYHLVEEQIREIRDDLPPGYYRQLPKLADGPFAGYPRVFGVAWAFVAHTDSRFDPDMLCRFVRAYQRVQPLTIGELWAVAITLRIVLVENLRRAAKRIVSSRAARRESNTFADRLLGVNGHAAEPVALVLQRYEHTPLPEAFAVQLVRRLRDQDPNVVPALMWLERRLTAQGTTADEIVRDEHQRQGAINVTTRNIITSMRLVSDVDWTELVESVSLVDDALHSGSDFANMDFPTRNLYRSAIEGLARGSKLTELEIARATLIAAADPKHQACREDDGVGSREHDPGYHLIAGGRPTFERTVGFRAPLRSWLVRCHTKIGIAGYIGGVIIVAAIVLLLPSIALGEPRIGGWSLGLLAVLGLIPSIDLAVAIVNRVVTSGFGTTILPGLELRDGVTSNLRTMVAVPTLLTTQAALEEQIERLEIHYLANPEGDLHFALLSDWTDASTEHANGDDALLDAAAQGIARLNRRYGPAPAGDRFLLLHRRRIWNNGQKQWIGWERKRGKLHELNRLLRGAGDTTFMAVGGQPLVPPPGVRYVITLDSDTRLPRETVRRLVGKMAHPLNHPRFDAATGRVVEGYAVLQPRVTPSLPIGREGSLFQRIFSSMGGIDPYASAVSDVYQDLFGEGSYAGKGIYDVDAFEAALDGRVPESMLLSHDLFEGTFARAGLASDVEVVEEFPSRYDVAAARHHRWARGDWQLLPWIFGRGDASLGNRGTSALPLIGLWKMLDNLRRTLSAPASVMALLAGWTLSLHSAAVWTCFILSTIAVPNLLPVLAAIVPRRARVTARSHLHALGVDLSLALSQIALAVTFLAHQAWSMTDAIGRTLFRLFVSRRHLLEWVTAAYAKLSPRLSLLGFYRQMAGGVVIGIVAAIVVRCAGGDAWLVAAPFVVLWIASPAVARWTSLSPLVAGRLSVSEADARALRLVARRTWRYFETFVTVADHMLPPDNFQEDPKPVLARRTSPTNLGLYLLSAVSARDFGWAGTTETVERLEATLATMSSLQRFRGHFYNWYDTGDLRPLDPRYVSSVDSGNLAGHLIAVANACREWISRPLAASRLFAGIEDALSLARDAIRELPDDRRTEFISRHELDSTLDILGAALHHDHSLPEELPAQLMDLARQAATVVDIAQTLASEYGDESGLEMLFWAQAAQRSIDSHRRDVTQTAEIARALNQRLAALESTARSMADAMEFGFLLDQDRKLLSIGYLVADGKLDVSCYDLLASEARLASFVAIAKGDIPPRHWFRLGRAVTPIERGAALISWSGSMFEYLMPSLVMRAPAGSLLEQTSRLIIRRQITYGTALGLPWGISESAYNARDLEFTYQYSNFGVPGLGLKRGLSENAVVAPYATALATMVEPAASARNFARLVAVGASGRYGFYEALDYTRSRLPEGKDCAVVRAFMAHHQGMTVVAIANALLDAEMRARFHAEPIVQATELLLQERTPRDVAAVRPRAEEVAAGAAVRGLELPTVRRLRSAHAATPEAHLLSNGRYAVMLTGAGSGYSRWRDLGITRWCEDTTRDDWGAYVFLRDVRSGDVWSAGYQPSGVEPASYDVTFSEDRAEFIRRDGTITTLLEIVVSPEDDAEVRRLSVSNAGNRVRDIELTSYAELALAPPAADAAHLTFSKLFVQTEYDAKVGAILATRRRRSPAEPEIWAAHLAVVEGETVGETEIETDRARFLGRGRDARAPIAVMDGRPLSNTVGTVLDPVFAFRRRVRIQPGETARIAFWTVVASSRADVLDLVDKHHDANAFERAATLAWTQAQVQLSHLGVDADEASLFQRLAGHVLYADRSTRPSTDTIRRGGGAPAALWAQGISGDIPIVLVRIEDIEDIAIVGQLLRAHEYWRMKQLAVDLVILNERASSYVQDLQIALETGVRTSQSHPRAGVDGARGSVFVLRTDLISRETRALLPSVARVVLAARHGSLSDQLDRFREANSTAPPPSRHFQPAEVPPSVPATVDLEFFNGLGGFAANGREYVTILGAGQVTPAPWTNVISNASFGFQVTVEGGGYTWSVNSRENQLTPWSNDPVTDRPGEVIFLRDEDTGELWGPTALPIRDEAAPYIVRHGQGYSRFEHAAHGIELDLLQYVPLDDPIKISRLTIRNTSARPRRLSVTAYVEWVLGSSRSASAPFIVTEVEPKTGALLARNPWNTAFGSRVAFADLAGRQTNWTGDRREFLGRNGTLDNPAALATEAPPLSKRVGAGLDPCGVLQAPLELEPDETVDIVFLLGEAATAADAQSLIVRYRGADLDAVFREVVQHWGDLLGTVQVSTPDRSMDIMLNRWLLYQTLVCRVWARSAFYQASGAYGFRDQLQDGMALTLSGPAMTREHLLRAAARQFVEGDVQHWWLPPFGQGVRTRISDDRIWLAYAVAHYVETTGDLAVLDESVPFLEGQALRPGEHDSYFQPVIANETASLFEHCARGLDQSLSIGEHGLPLIGTGDWNDGLNRVGELGKGESVWVGWFLHATLSAFAPLAETRQERARAGTWRSHAVALQTSLERDGWDGSWYRRGYFDDGTPFGSSASDECRIDSIAQSWSVISGAADPARAARAMAAVEDQLIRREAGLALLFTPPFDLAPLDPGYIKGYPPGIRENGGQYTHAAAWSMIAFATLGDGDQAADLFSLINPINHSHTRASVHRYKVEPFVTAADVYSEPPHVGRGGWTWYTGSAGWMYRGGIESILGLRLRGAFLLLAPCIPKHWSHFEIVFQYASTRYEIAVENPHGVSRGITHAEFDGQRLSEGPIRVHLHDDGTSHKIRAVLG